MKKLAALLWTGCLLAIATPTPARAFCGFYVTGADTSLYANATMVVLMRDGMRTVLSMQNNYQGPPEEFALVIPVPTILTEDMVQTLPREVFKRVDALAAPRLVEYWEGDPCAPPPPQIDWRATAAAGEADTGSVTVEAQFAVGEYDVVILSANDSSGLETWLHDNQYNIPDGANSVLAPYVAMGTKFFVAKVDPSRVTFDNGQAALSPLRFHYDTDTFTLPIRLGLLNSQGTQDLIVSILAPSRYEAANHPNVTIPTNIRVKDSVRDDFPGFYEALFSKLMEKNPGAVVTEYAWSAGSCDPCPTPPLSPEDIATLGADVTASGPDDIASRAFRYTLTRLHYRYTAETLGEDLVFKEAPSLFGGRGVPDPDGNLEPNTEIQGQGADNFQGRYVILHPWEKEISCQAPMRGRWGGPDNPDSPPMSMSTSNTALTGTPARAAADLASLVAEPIATLDVEPAAPGTTAEADPKASDAGAGQSQATANPADAGKPNTPAADSGTAAAQAGRAGELAPSQVDAGTATVASTSESNSDSGCSCQLGKAPTPRTPGSLAWLALTPALWVTRRLRRRQTMHHKLTSPNHRE